MKTKVFLLCLLTCNAVGRVTDQPAPAAERFPGHAGRTEFFGVPIRSVAPYLGRLARKMVLVRWDADCRIHGFVGEDLPSTAMASRLLAVIGSNGCQVVESASWIKIMPTGQRDVTKDPPHVEVLIHDGQLIVDDAAMSLGQMARYVEKQSRVTEVWIVDWDFTSSLQAALPVDLTAQTVVSALGGIEHGRIYLADLDGVARPDPVAQIIVHGERGGFCRIRASYLKDGKQHDDNSSGGLPSKRMFYRRGTTIVSCEIERVTGTGEFAVDLYQRTNLVFTARLPEGKHILRVKQSDSRWIQEVAEPCPVDSGVLTGTNVGRRVPFRRDDAAGNTNEMPVKLKGNFETVQTKVLKVFAVEDNEAKFRAYLVKWKDFEVIVQDPLARTDKKEGELITFMVNRSELSQGEQKSSLLSFVIFDFPARP